MSWRLIQANPADLVVRPKVQRREARALSGVEVAQLLKAARGDRLEALYVLAVATGLRQGELFGLRWKDIDLAARTLSGATSGRRKVLPSGKTYVFKEFFGLESDIEDPWPDGRDPETLSRYRERAAEMKAILETNFEHLLQAMGPLRPDQRD
ncbi:MAG: tyrosine-type recombinase/integrase [Myxococcota bacterium]